MDKNALFAPRCPEDDVDLPGVGTVRVRGLTRAESMLVSELKGNAVIERRVIAIGMVDPVLTEAEVGQWYRAAPAGELQQVAAAIQRLSGLDEGADKSDPGPAGDN